MSLKRRWVLTAALLAQALGHAPSLEANSKRPHVPIPEAARVFSEKIFKELQSIIMEPAETQKKEKVLRFFHTFLDINDLHSRIFLQSMETFWRRATPHERQTLSNFFQNLVSALFLYSMKGVRVKKLTCEPVKTLETNRMWNFSIKADTVWDDGTKEDTHLQLSFKSEKGFFIQDISYNKMNVFDFAARCLKIMYHDFQKQNGPKDLGSMMAYFEKHTHRWVKMS